MAWIGRCGAPPGEEIGMRQETEGCMNGNVEELQDGIAKQMDPGCYKYCGFSYNADFGILDEGGESDA